MKEKNAIEEDSCEKKEMNKAKKAQSQVRI